MIQLVNILKNLPFDLGQGNQRFVTKGKLMAMKLVPANGQGKTLLDVGCREGAQSRRFEELGYQVTSIDIEKIYDRCQVVDCNNGLPFADESFDVIWSSEVIEHLINPATSTSEMRRVLKKGGVMVLTTPNSFAFYFSLLAAVGLTPQRSQRKDHIHFFDDSRIRMLFPKASVTGYVPFSGIRPEISKGVGLLSPTFVIVEYKDA